MCYLLKILTSFTLYDDKDVERRDAQATVRLNMSVTNGQLDTETLGVRSIINDFAITVATQNGSGSQTSNNVLVRALFSMGIPVNGKNLFPSNIKGLPTWYTIRASKEGYIARREVPEVLVAFNEMTAAEDIQNLPPGGVCVIRGDWKWRQSRDDVIYYEVPVKELMNQIDVHSEFRTRMENMTYVGVLAALFCIPHREIYQALLKNFGGKEKVARMNMDAVEIAYDWAMDNLEKRDAYCYGRTARK